MSPAVRTFDMTRHDSSLRSPSVDGTGRQEAASGGAGTTPASRETRPSVYRRGLTLILVLLAALGVIASVLSIWSHQVLLNTDRFVATVEPVARDPEVISAVSQRVGEEIVIALDIQRRAADVLPERAGFLTDSLATAKADFIQNRLETFFSR